MCRSCRLVLPALPCTTLGGGGCTAVSQLRLPHPSAYAYLRLRCLAMYFRVRSRLSSSEPPRAFGMQHALLRRQLCQIALLRIRIRVVLVRRAPLLNRRSRRRRRRRGLVTTPSSAAGAPAYTRHHLRLPPPPAPLQPRFRVLRRSRSTRPFSS